MNKCLLLIFIWLLNTKTIFAQKNMEQNRKDLEDATENSAEEINDSGQNEIPEELINLINHPVNLNTDNLDILIRYNLLSNIQLNSLKIYQNKSGKLVELEELQQVEGFDKKTIEKIIPYCNIISSKSEQPKHQLTMRFQRGIQNEEIIYPGSNSKILVKYKAVLSSKWAISFSGEKDAGEEIFIRKNKMFDFNSFSIYYKGNSFLKKIIAGDYTIEYGQGLTAWTGLSFESGANITSIFKYGRGIIPYTGTDENKFFRGMAISFQKNKLRYDLWISHHAIDGNIIRDTINNLEYISSLQTSGFHRTISEIQDKHSQLETAFGASIIYSSGKVTSGIVLSGQHYKKSIQNTNQVYNNYDFKGKDNFNIGWNYSYTIRNILLFGETAYNINNSFASLNGLLMSIDPRFSIGILWRSYSRNFTSLKSNAFGVNTKNANEQGKYFGIIFKLTRTLTYTGYTDIYSFPFLKYRVDQPSRGYDFFHQLEYSPTKKFAIQLRYRNKLKQLNDESANSGINNLSDNVFSTTRFSARFKIDNVWEYSFRVELTSEYKSNKHIGNGTLIAQDIFFHPMGKSYSVNCRYAVFNCPQFDTRIYQYENDVQGAFSIPFYYGTGSRFYTNFNYKISRGLTFSVRYAISWFNANPTSSENSEIKLQLKAILR